MLLEFPPENETQAFKVPRNKNQHFLVRLQVEKGGGGGQAKPYHVENKAYTT